MKKKLVFLVAGVAASIYVLPRALNKAANGFENLANRFEKLSLNYRFASICTTIVKEHPELHDDPRLVAFNEDFDFFELRENYNKD